MSSWHDGDYSFLIEKMAEGWGSQANRGIFVGGRARALLNATAYFKNERVGRGRAGMGPNLRINNNTGVTSKEAGPPHGRAHALGMLVPGPGVSHHGEGEAEVSLSQHPPHLHQPHLNLWVEDFLFHPNLLHPLPLKIVPHLWGTKRPLLGNPVPCPIAFNPWEIPTPPLWL